ncbi:DNA repair protein RecN [Bizionia gelidisalsuginis]|uniref:DNA repair protein RecN n=1 Tax=Bizionia gelidisalsuginis TaxID=291188 RepID=A0ABY3MEB3_9FLAO|nr:DNA repair protein RecN [Bizionia gelidisalsuginis]TYC17947.1 DNA repair protein RecN [Bizionia gelidisalsuginis]
MLSALTIKNYALIDHLQVDFTDGFTIITGETGAGKSILLGGLSLILGKRADLSSLRDTTKKCVIEAQFNIVNYNLEGLFTKNDIDFEPLTIIRREILPSGKSRAFINDSPVNLNVLQLLGSQLIDIHSQNETLQLVDDAFQFQVIDALAENTKDLHLYSERLSAYKKLKKELLKLKEFQAEALKEHDYNSYLLKELLEAKLKEGELEALEEEFESLNNVEQIQERLTIAQALFNEENIGILTSLTELKNTFVKLSGLASKYKPVSDRVTSSLIDLDDIFGEVEEFQEQLDANPNRLEEVNAKLMVLNNLFKKHFVKDVAELIILREALDLKVADTENVEANIVKKEEEISVVQATLDKAAQQVHKKRLSVLPKLKKELETILVSLGMPNAQFNIALKFGETYFSNGREELSFLFSANKGGQFNILKKAASGGELSRIMLAIKSILTQYVKLPTIMFDEIDTGVSGEISNKMADIMAQMSTAMQVFSITHLPQIAAKGETHFKVFKEDVNEVTTTNLVKLNPDDRVIEIAQMLGGIEVSTSALAHAKQLLN